MSGCQPVKCTKCPNSAKECKMKDGLCPICYANKINEQNNPPIAPIEENKQ